MVVSVVVGSAIMSSAADDLVRDGQHWCLRGGR